jgi:hypothetical protein
MLLAEDLLLLLTDDATGRLVVSGTETDVALAGAQLVDLSLAGRVDVDERKRLVVVDGSTTGDDLLDQALEVARRREGKKPSRAISELGKGLRGVLYDRLADAGYVRSEHGTVLGLFPRTSWPAGSVDHEAGVRRALTAVLVQGISPEPRDAALISLLHALRSTHKVVDPKQHDLRRRDLDRRAKEIAEGSWGSDAVRETVDAMTAAVMVSVMAATAATSAAS